METVRLPLTALSICCRGIGQRQNTTLQSFITGNVVETLFHLIEICYDTIQIHQLCENPESRVLDPMIKSSYFILLSQ
jgi:hypothetical protein